MDQCLVIRFDQKGSRMPRAAARARPNPPDAGGRRQAVVLLPVRARPDRPEVSKEALPRALRYLRANGVGCVRPWIGSGATSNDAASHSFVALSQVRLRLQRVCEARG